MLLSTHIRSIADLQENEHLTSIIGIMSTVDMSYLTNNEYSST